MPAYGVEGDLAATSSYGGVRLFLAMILTWLMGGSANQFMIPLFLNVARGLTPFRYDALPVATGGVSKAGSWPPKPSRVYPGLVDGREDTDAPPTWAPSTDYLAPPSSGNPFQA